MKFHWGEPKYDATLRFQRGTMSNMVKHKVWPKAYGHQHTLRKWYGVSFGSKCFIGIQLYHNTQEWRDHAKGN